MSDTDLKEKEEAAGSHDDLGVHSERAEAEAAELEKNFANSPSNGDSDGGLYRPEENRSKPQRGFLKTARQRATAGILTTVIASGGIFGAIQAPGMFINQLRELLLTRISELQNHHNRRFRRRKFTKIGDMFSRDGRRGGKIITEMEARGYQFISDPNDNKRVIGLIKPGGDGIPSYAIADHIEDYLEVRHPLRTSKWKTKRMEAFYGRYKVSRRPVVVPSANDPPDNPEAAVNKNMYQDVKGDGLDTRVDGRLQADENDTDAQAQQKESTNADAEKVASSDGSLEGLERRLAAGESIDDFLPEERALLNVTEELSDDVLDTANTRAASGIGLGGITSFFKSADIFDRVCTLKKRLAGVQFAARNYRAVSMLRYTSSFIKVADKIRAGKASPGNIDPKMLNALMGRVTAVDRNGNSLGASPGMAYVLKGKFSKSRNDTFKGSYGVDGKLSGTPAALQSATDVVPGLTPTSCGVIQNPVAQVGLVVVELGIGFFTGGASEATIQGGKEAMKLAFKSTMKSLFSKKVAKEIGKSLLVELTFEGALMFTQMYAEKSMSIPFTGQERGGVLGNILSGGGGSLGKQRGLQSGLVPATPAQYSAAQEELALYKKEIQANQSLYARLLDYNNQDSLVFQATSTLATAPLSLEGVRSAASNNIASIQNVFLGGPMRLFMSVFFSKAYAQTSDEIAFETYSTTGGNELATDPAGNPLVIMRDDISSIDSDANIASLIASDDIQASEPYEPKSDRFKKHVTNCVEAMDIFTTIETKDQSDPQYDCMASQQITKQFKAHLAYIDMLDVIDSNLFSEEI